MNSLTALYLSLRIFSYACVATTEVNLTRLLYRALTHSSVHFSSLQFTSVHPSRSCFIHVVNKKFTVCIKRQSLAASPRRRGARARDAPVHEQRPQRTCYIDRLRHALPWHGRQRRPRRRRVRRPRRQAEHTPSAASAALSPPLPSLPPPPPPPPAALAPPAKPCPPGCEAHGTCNHAVGRYHSCPARRASSTRCQAAPRCGA